MNTINRIVAIVVFLLLLLLVFAIALSPGDSLNWMQIQLANFSSSINRFQAADPTNYTIARIAVVVAAILVLVPLIFSQFSSETESTVSLRTSEGNAKVTTDSIERRLSWHLDQLADVISVEPQVQARGDAVNIQLGVVTSPEIDVPMKTEEVILVTRDIVEGQMGLKVNKIDVSIRHSDYPALV